MTEAEVDRVARAIASAMRRGVNRPWALARTALAASDAYRGADQILARGLAKSMAKVARYSSANKKGWETRKRMKQVREAARAAAEGKRDAA